MERRAETELDMQYAFVWDTENIVDATELSPDTGACGKYDCRWCEMQVFYRKSTTFYRDMKLVRRRACFAHKEGESCLQEFSVSETQQNNERESRERGLNWVQTLKLMCRADTLDVAVAPGRRLRADVTDGNRAIFLQLGQITNSEVAYRTELCRANGKQCIWFLNRDIGSVRIFSDVLYDGTAAELAQVDGLWRFGTDAYIDVGTRGKIVRTSAFADGNTYFGRCGRDPTMLDAEDALAVIFGGALIADAKTAAAELRKIQMHRDRVAGPSGGRKLLAPLPQFVDWQQLRRGANAMLGLPLDSGTDARESYRRALIETRGWSGTYVPFKFRDDAELITPDAEQRAEISHFMSVTLEVLLAQAGSGKSVVAMCILRAFDGLEFTVASTGSTNRAALAMSGRTLHNFAAIPTELWLSQRRILHDAQNLAAATRLRLRDVCVHVTDEIGQTPPEVSECYHENAKAARNIGHLPFGGIIVFATGDPRQTPPVIEIVKKREEINFFSQSRNAKYIEEAYAQKPLQKFIPAVNQARDLQGRDEWGADRFSWGNLPDLHVRSLTKNYRQIQDEDLTFVVQTLCVMKKTYSNHYELGYDTDSKRVIELLKDRVTLVDDLVDDLPSHVTRVVAHKTETVSALNSNNMEDKKKQTFTMTWKFEKKWYDINTEREYFERRTESDTDEAAYAAHAAYSEWTQGVFLDKMKCIEDMVTISKKRSRDADKLLYVLAENQNVMFMHEVKVDDETIRKNTSGKIISLDDGGVIVEVGRRRLRITPSTFVIEDTAGGTGTVTMVPLRGAFATTIHSCQSETFKNGTLCVVVDLLNGWWPSNLGYTALTRVQTLRDIVLLVRKTEFGGDLERVIRRAFTIDKKSSDIYKLVQK